MKSYTLQQIQQMLTEPSFNGWVVNNSQVNLALEVLSEAIEHHEKLDKADDGEGF